MNVKYLTKEVEDTGETMRKQVRNPIQVSKGICGQRVNSLKPAVIQLKKLNTFKTKAVVSSPRYLDLQMTMKILKKHFEVTCFVWEKCID